MDMYDRLLVGERSRLPLDPAQRPQSATTSPRQDLAQFLAVQRRELAGWERCTTFRAGSEYVPGWEQASGHMASMGARSRRGRSQETAEGRAETVSTQMHEAAEIGRIVMTPPGEQRPKMLAFSERIPESDEKRNRSGPFAVPEYEERAMTFRPEVSPR